MMVLAIDTCGVKGSIALGSVGADAVQVFGQTELAGKTYSAQLASAVRSLLADHSVGMGALSAIVVANGPGSFTGVRIGVSSAKGFAEALEIPLLAVSRLAVLAWKAGVERAVLDAGRNEFYCRDGMREVLLSASDVASSISSAIAVCEPGAQRIFPGVVLVDPPTAGDALRFAAPKLLAGEFADVSTLDGNYVRRADAEIFAKPAGKV
jgi:tRNA threonylcarbamoyladenosine biosynthesis protein TsaB